MFALVQRGRKRMLGDVSAGLNLTSLASAGIGAGVSLAATAITAWLGSIQLSHQQDTATTQIVNGLEPKLRANVAAYLAGNRSQCSQQVALAAFDSAFNWLISSAGCGNGAYGSAGNRCITDRDRGGQFDWYSYYRDPIANDRATPGTACPGTTVSGSGQTLDSDNDLQALLPGSQSSYFALINAGGASGVIGNPTAVTPTAPASTSTASVFAGLSNEQLLIGGLAAAVLVWVVASK